MTGSLWSLHLKLLLFSMLLVAGMVWHAAVEAASLRLNWRDSSSNETGFKIERQNGSSFTEVGTVGANLTSYTDSSLTDGVMYCYRVRAFNSAGSSSPSNQACANATGSGLIGSPGGSNGSSSGTTPAGSTPPPGGSSNPTPTSGVGNRWTDYRVTLKMKSSDNDSIGVMFRYVDSRNYYRFSWNVQEGFRRLEKIQNGVATVLAQDSVRFVVGRAYQAEIVVRDSLLNLLIDGAQVFSVTDSSFDGGTIALYAWYNQAATFDDVVVQDLATGAVLASENFNDGDFVGWTIMDEGTDGGPSVWSLQSGALVQSSNIGSSSGKRGTYALYTKGSWTDYRVTLKMKSSDDDSMGVMFRYVDSRNYYRFSWNLQEGFRRLEKIRNGVATVLAQDLVRFVVGRAYQVEIVARDSLLSVLIDGAQVFSVPDSSFDGGTIALYAWYNQAAIFDDVVVHDLGTGAVLLSENFNDGNFVGWTIIDEGTDGGPSAWSVQSGALVQSGNIGSTTGKRGTYALY